MEDQLVTFETAKLAKEKGFKNKTLYYYPWNSETYTIHLDGYGPLTKDANSLNLGFSAPTQSLLQKWLREAGINIEVLPEEDETHKLIWIPVVYALAKIDDSMDFGIHNSYEQALEVGLIQALNLV